MRMLLAMLTFRQAGAHRVLVTGASGLIGRELMELLKNDRDGSPCCTTSQGQIVPLSLQQFPMVTSIGSLPPKNLGKSRGTPHNPRRTLGETLQSTLRNSAEPSERQISSESLAEGCAPRMVTLRNFRTHNKPQIPHVQAHQSETGRLRFRRARVRALGSVRVFVVVLTELWGESSVSSSQPDIVCAKQTHRVSRGTQRVWRRT